MDLKFDDSQRVVRCYLAGMSVCPPYLHQFNTVGEMGRSVPENESSNLRGEDRDKCADLIEKFKQARNHRLSLPLTKLPERYTRGDFSIILNCSTDRGMIGLGKFALCIQFHSVIQFGHTRREVDFSTGINDDKVPVLIESIHVVDDEKRLISSVGPSLVRLNIFDPSEHPSVLNTFYFSVVKFDVVTLHGFGLKHRKFDGILGLDSLFISSKTGEVPDDMVKAGSKLMNDFSCKDAETQWNALSSMVVDRFLPHLGIFMGDGWVLATVDESLDFGMQVDDILIGPF